MPSLVFRSADRYASAQLGGLLTRTYTGYDVPVQVDAARFESMIAAYDIDLGASRVGVLHREPVAIALLGVRGDRGWIGGMGVAPECRGEGFGMGVMKAVIGSARRRRLRHIDLEVLTQNEPAIRIYQALGFRRRRTLDIWMRDSDATFPMPPQHDVKPLDVSACLAVFDDLHAVMPPWQRDLPSLQRLASRLHGLGVIEGGHLVSYVLYRMKDAHVRIEDVAAAPGHSAAMIESTLRALIRDRSGSPIRLVNLPHDDPATTVMHRIGAQVEMQQVEMTLDL